MEFTGDVADMGGSGYVMIAAEADYSTLTVANVKVDFVCVGGLEGQTVSSNRLQMSSSAVSTNKLQIILSL